VRTIQFYTIRDNKFGSSGANDGCADEIMKNNKRELLKCRWRVPHQMFQRSNWEANYHLMERIKMS
jgi:hypothetical protein